MSILIENFHEVKTVTKPWGWEKWIQPGSDRYPFVLKQLMLQAGQRTSLQVHQFKSESILILEGTGKLLHCVKHFDCEQYLKGQYTLAELDSYILNLRETTLSTGMVLHTPPGSIHRMVATTDLLYMEASTTELDDVIRLQDDQKRQHGRILSEHQ